MLLKPENTTTLTGRVRKPRAATGTACLNFDPADGPRLLLAREDTDRTHAPRAAVRLPSETRQALASSEVSDEVLAERCKTELPHNLESFEELVRRHEARVLNSCTAMIGNRFDAEEICQDVFVQVFRKIHQFEGRSTFKTWLFRIAYNMCLTRRGALARRREREEKFAEEVDVIECAKMADAGIGKLSNSVQEALSRLDEQKRGIVALKFVSGLSHEEIAAKLNLKLSAAKMRFYRALDEFKVAYLEITGENLAA